MKLLYTVVFLLTLSSCKKFLDEKPSASLAVPETLDQAQSLLDYYPKMNNVDPASPEISAGDYYLTYNDWSGLAENFRRMYTWEKDYLYVESFNEWSQLFDNVYSANTAIEVVQKIPKLNSNEVQWNNVSGQAYFARGRAFLNAAAIWAKAYNEQTASTDLGIPLRLSTDFNIPSKRSSVRETYQQIIDDLKMAASLLPLTPVHKMRASKPAAFGLLARTFLWMGKFDKAALYADTALQLYNTLVDYNTVNGSRTYPFSEFNEEVIFHSRIPSPAPIINSRAKIDSVLYKTFAEGDLRKALFFKINADGSFRFRGSYTGNAALFSGVSTNELYLTKAESLARLRDIAPAMKALNTLLEKRWKASAFLPLRATTAEEALKIILVERRKELMMRGLRWMDIKRLNEEGAGIKLQRILNGETFELLSKDPRFALPLPEDVIALSGMEQNPR